MKEKWKRAEKRKVIGKGQKKHPKEGRDRGKKKVHEDEDLVSAYGSGRKGKILFSEVGSGTQSLDPNKDL